MKQMLLSPNETNTDRISLSQISTDETLGLCCMLLRSVYVQNVFFLHLVHMFMLMYNLPFQGFGVGEVSSGYSICSESSLWKETLPLWAIAIDFFLIPQLNWPQCFARRPLYFTASYWPIVCVLAGGQSVCEWFVAQAGEAVKGSLIHQSTWVCREEQFWHAGWSRCHLSFPQR